MNQTIQKLERRTADLIKVTESVRRENEVLRNDLRMLQQTCQSLQEKNRIAHGRVEQIVARLKSLEV